MAEKPGILDKLKESKLGQKASKMANTLKEDAKNGYKIVGEAAKQSQENIRAADEAKAKERASYVNDLKTLDNKAFKDKYKLSKEGFANKNKIGTSEWIDTKDEIDKNKSLENLEQKDPSKVMNVKDPVTNMITKTAVTPETRAMLEGDQEVIRAQDMQGKESEIGLRSNANQTTANMAEANAKATGGEVPSNISVVPAEEPQQQELPLEQSQPAQPPAQPELEQQPAEEQKQEATQSLSGASDEQVANLLEQTSNEIQNPQADARFKSIWQAWKDGDIDKNTRNYFLVDALASFGKDLANIKHAQSTNAMWANIQSGNQINPAEGVNLKSDWRDYLKTDWTEAQKLKNEAKSKTVLGNIENNLEVARKYGVDNYLVNTKPELLKSSKMTKMWKEDPDLALQITQMSALNDGQGAFSTDDLANMYDVVGNAKLGNQMGEEAYKAAKLDNKSKTLDNIAKAQENAFNAATADIRKRMLNGELTSQQADNLIKQELAKQAELDSKYYEQAKKLGLDINKADLKLKQDARVQNWINTGTSVLNTATDVAGTIATGGLAGAL